MGMFRAILIAMTILIIVFTITAVADGGIDLLTPFLSPIAAMNWQGQFNVDFTCYLVLSGLWMMWRQGFSGTGIAMGLVFPPLGILFFAPYLLYLLSKENGDLKRVLLGVHAEPDV